MSALESLRARLRVDQGLTLAELLVVVVIAGVIAAATMSVVLSTIETERKTTEMGEVLHEARLAFDRLRAEAREAREVNVLVGGEAVELEIGTPPDDATVTYRVDSDPGDATGVLIREEAGQERVVARRIEAEETLFEYDETAAQRVLEIQIPVRGDSGEYDLSNSGTVRLRNVN